MTDLETPLGRILVLDLETQPDPQATGLAGTGGEIGRTALHRIHAVSTLRAVEAEDGAWEITGPNSREDASETRLLDAIHAELAWLAEGQGMLATYNGRAHDLGILRRRVVANFRFELALPAMLRAVRHADLMRDPEPAWKGGWPSLRDACAGLGIACDPNLTSGRAPLASRRIRKGQVDVVATFLLLLHEVALVRGTAAPLLAGWRALAEHLGRPGIKAPHLEQFRWHPRIEAPRG